MPGRHPAALSGRWRDGGTAIGGQAMPQGEAGTARPAPSGAGWARGGVRRLTAVLAGAVILAVSGCSQGPAGSDRPAAGSGSPAAGPAGATSLPPSRSSPSAARAGVTQGTSPAGSDGPWQPDDAQLPADVPVGRAACASLTRPAGWLATEDAQVGDAGFELPSDGGGRVVVGYADRRSATCGDVVGVSLSGPSSV
ncbi:MAG TPA: hypothetical protein VI248_20930, partial [Kineosporiaceae bacterium]